MKVTLNVKNLERARASLKRYRSSVEKGIMEAVQTAALAGIDRAKRQPPIPVDTGTLRSSIQILDTSIEGKAVEYGTRIHYAEYQERRRGYMETSKAVAQQTLDSEVEKILESNNL